MFFRHASDRRLLFIVPWLVLLLSSSPAAAQEVPPQEPPSFDIRFDFQVVDRFLDELSGGPESAAEEIGERELATVLFTDIVSSTERVAEAGDAAWRAMLDRHEQAAVQAIEAARGRLVEHTGDGVLATFGGPSHAVSAARSMQDAGVAMGVAVRAGVHTGEVERRGDRIGGIGVHIAARILGLAGGGEILASRTVRDLAVGSKLVFEDRGTHALKGVAEPWQVFAVS